MKDRLTASKAREIMNTTRSEAHENKKNEIEQMIVAAAYSGKNQVSLDYNIQKEMADQLRNLGYTVYVSMNPIKKGSTIVW